MEIFFEFVHWKSRVAGNKLLLMEVLFSLLSSVKYSGEMLDKKSGIKNYF